MTTEIMTQAPRGNAVARLWHWLSALEDAVDRDPADALRHRIAQLEARIETLERAAD